MGKLCRQFMFSHGNIKEEPPHDTRTNTTFKLYRLHCPFTIFHWFAYSFDAYFNFVLDEIACMLYSYGNSLLSMLFISSLVSCMCCIISYTGFRSIERTTCAKTIATPYTTCKHNWKTMRSIAQIHAKDERCANRTNEKHNKTPSMQTTRTNVCARAIHRGSIRVWVKWYYYYVVFFVVCSKRKREWNNFFHINSL